MLQRWEVAHSWLSSQTSYIDALITDWSMWANEIGQISSELQQLDDSVERTPSDAVTGTTSRRANQVARQLEQVRVLQARWKALRPQTEAILTLISKRATKITMESNHDVPRKYTIVGDQIRDLYSMLQEINSKMEGELDAQNKFTNDVERLVHTVSIAEKRLSKITGIWIPSALPSLLAPRGTHSALQTRDGKLPLIPSFVRPKINPSASA